MMSGDIFQHRFLEILWSPWRMSYISTVDKIIECIFCKALEEPERYHVITVTEHSILMLNAYPYNTAHVMIAPKRHVPDLILLEDREILDMFSLMKKTIQAIRKEYNPQGFNIGVNIGRVAGAGVESHVHIHIVPRWSGDTNFLPIISATKTIPEDLETTRKRIKRSLESL
ncbi:MAG: HIT domain-containing protein [Sulfolobales archaeon]